MYVCENVVSKTSNHVLDRVRMLWTITRVMVFITKFRLELEMACTSAVSCFDACFGIQILCLLRLNIKPILFPSVHNCAFLCVRMCWTVWECCHETQGWRVLYSNFNVTWRWHLYVQSLDKLMVHCNVALETEHIDGFLSISAEVCVMIKKVLYFLCVEKTAIWAMWECCIQKLGWWVWSPNFTVKRHWHLHLLSLAQLLVWHWTMALEIEHIAYFVSVIAEVRVMITRVLYFVGHAGMLRTKIRLLGYIP